MHQQKTIAIVTILTAVVECIVVSPSLCPTNKIAPYRRVTSYNRPSGRTFAAYYDLLKPNTPHTNPQNHLQEQPQQDQPDDCGDIEDYDENDLSSVTPNQGQQYQYQRRGRQENRFLFGGLFNRPPQHLPAYQPTSADSTSTRPMTRPPRPHIHKPAYWSGGLFGNNQYKPPINQDPSDIFKPVHEAADVSEAPQTYRPNVVGGPLGHVVGVTQVRPTTPSQDEERTRRRLEYYSNLRMQPTQPTVYSIRRPRPRNVIGSFLDLFLK